MRTGDYFIYKFSDGEDVHFTEYFLPDTDLERKFDRLLTIARHKTNGFKVVGLVKVDRNTWFNARVDELVADYCQMDKDEQEYKSKYRLGQMNREVFFDTMRLLQDHKWTILKQIDMRLTRMLREDMDIENEVAIQLFDSLRQAYLV